MTRSAMTLLAAARLKTRNPAAGVAHYCSMSAMSSENSATSSILSGREKEKVPPDAERTESE